MTFQDRKPNFRTRGQLFLVHCYKCDRENYHASVASGTCAWCGWHEQAEDTNQLSEEQVWG